MDFKPLSSPSISFYRTGDAYGCFSNFSAHSFTINGEFWATAEHYFQAKKFEGTIHEVTLRKEESPMVVARMGRDRSRPLRRNWELVKLDVMRKALSAKFDQNNEIKNVLIGTGDAELIEHTENDSYWGDGGDGTGLNMLGKLLMELRVKLSQSTC